MQLKRLVLITVAYVMLALVIAVPALAAGEQGTGTLYAHSDPERKTLVEVDSNGRYYVVPGTEYYFNISGISEYTADQEITIWAFRVNTAEDVTIGNAIVDSDTSLVFDWTIPEDWLDEAVKIKYGITLENNWVYAQKEIWVNCRVGSGILFAYEDSDRTDEAPFDGDEMNYLVNPSLRYYFRITGATDDYSPETPICVWAFYRIGTTSYDCVRIYEGPAASVMDFDWEIPSTTPLETSIKFKYGTSPTGRLPNWYFARRDTVWPAPRLLLVIPGVFLGSIGAITALFSGWGIKLFLSRRRWRHSPL